MFNKFQNVFIKKMDDFTRKFLKHFITKLAVVEKNQQEASDSKKDQIDSISETMLDIFVDATLLHMKRLTNETMKVVEHAGRTDANVLDVFDALWVYHENCESIFNFIIDFPKMDTVAQVPEYPKPAEANSDETLPTFPYRADALVEFNGLTSDWLPPHIPQFLPSMSESSFEDRYENNTDFTVQINDIKHDSPLPVINVNNTLVDNIVKSVIGTTDQTYVEPTNV